jgi:hypothetical protein
VVTIPDTSRLLKRSSMTNGTDVNFSCHVRVGNQAGGREGRIHDGGDLPEASSAFHVSSGIWDGPIGALDRRRGATFHAEGRQGHGPTCGR